MKDTKYLLVERCIELFLRHTLRTVYGLTDTGYVALFRQAIKGDAFAYDLLMLSTPNYELPVEEFTLEYQALKLVQSYPHYPMSSDESRRQAAIQDFHECEAICAAHATTIDNDDAVMVNLLKQADLIADILGEAPTLEQLKPFHGSGASVDSRGVGKHPLLKAHVTGITQNAIQLANAFENSPSICTALDKKGFTILEHAVFLTVGKNSVTDRGIEINASLNLALQQPVRLAMEDRLRKVGIDISSHHDPEKQWIAKGKMTFNRTEVLTPEKHGEYARVGSIDHSFSTLDVKSSSNLQALRLHEVLLSRADKLWWEYYSLTRHDTVTIDDQIHTLKKGAGMGNAIIFPLQTLVYYTAAKTACPDAFVSVFGDDIVVSSEHVDEVISYLIDNLGVVINAKKSHWNNSYFRESCGYDFYKGCRIPKFKCQNLDKMSYRETSIWIHNAFQRLASLDDSLAHGGLYNRVCAEIRKTGAANVPIVPVEYGTHGYIGPRTHWDVQERGMHGFKIRGLMRRSQARDHVAAPKGRTKWRRTQTHYNGSELRTITKSRSGVLKNVDYVLDPDIVLMTTIYGTKSDTQSGLEPYTVVSGVLTVPSFIK